MRTPERRGGLIPEPGDAGLPAGRGTLRSLLRASRERTEGRRCAGFGRPGACAACPHARSHREFGAGLGSRWCFHGMGCVPSDGAKTSGSPSLRQGRPPHHLPRLPRLLLRLPRPREGRSCPQLRREHGVHIRTARIRWLDDLVSDRPANAESRVPAFRPVDHGSAGYPPPARGRRSPADAGSNSSPGHGARSRAGRGSGRLTEPRGLGMMRSRPPAS